MLICQGCIVSSQTRSLNVQALWRKRQSCQACDVSTIGHRLVTNLSLTEVRHDGSVAFYRLVHYPS